MQDPGRAEPGRKTFIPLENNPTVFTPLAAELLGTSVPGLSFHDIFSIDTDALAAIPRPVDALIVTIPRGTYHRRRALEPNQPLYNGCGDTEPVMWFRQTIGHACGLISLLHALTNTTAKQHATPASVLSSILKKTTSLQPTQRAAFLYDSAALEAAHARAAQLGDTLAPAPELDNANHFITFVRGADNHLWELEGGVPGPIDRGFLKEGEDMISEEALEAGVKVFLGVAEEDLDFSLVAMCIH